MEQLILIIHVLCAVGLVGLVLLQQGKGATMGASFGSGASQTLFGATGSVGFLGKITAAFALVFFLTSFALALIATEKAAQSDEFQVELPAVVESDAAQERLFIPGEEAAGGDMASQPQGSAENTPATAVEEVPLLEQDEVSGEPEVPAVD